MTNPSFQGVIKDYITVYTKYYVPTLEMKVCDVMINGQNVFMNPLKIDLVTYDKLKRLPMVEDIITLLIVY